MAAPPIEDLQSLLKALGVATNLRERMGILARSWQLLRSLSPVQREQVALRVGSKWAWKRIEKAFLGDGHLSDNEKLIGRAFERLGEADPGELRQLARSIKDGNRNQAKDALAETLTNLLEEAAEEAPPLETTVAPPPVVELPPVEEAPPAELGAPAEAAPVEADEATQGSEPEVADPLPASSTEPRAPEVVVLPPEPTRAEPVPASPAPVSRVHREEPAPSFELEDFEASPPTSSGAERLRILRELQRGASSVARQDRSQRAALIEGLGGGWASRRALSQMISAKHFADVDEALDLIDRLERPGQRLWCLADLLEYWELSEPQIERVLDQAPTEAARRRLASRRADRYASSLIVHRQSRGNRSQLRL